MTDRWSLPARRRVGLLVASVLAASAGLVAAGQAAAAPAAPPPVSAPLTAPATPAPSRPPATVIAAMERDLQFDADQVRARQVREAAAPAVEHSLRTTLGEGFGGAWLSRDGVLHIGVTSARDAPAVRAAGATPQVVEHSEQQLDEAMATLDSHAETAPRSVHSWHIDLPTNRVVITVQSGQTEAARVFRVDAGLRSEIVRVVAGNHQPQPAAINLSAGEAIHMDFTRCSSGFAVEGGIVTAGHCHTWTGDIVGPGGYKLGSWGGWSFPVHDYAWIETSSMYNPVALAEGLGVVAGSREAVVGTAVCRSGSTTGVRCGWLLYKDFTANYKEGAVYGLSVSDACAEKGDSGGPFMAGDQAQGVASGAAGTCDDEGSYSYFQPINPILSAYDLTLKTSSPVPPWWDLPPGNSERTSIHTDVNGDGFDDVVAFYDYYNSAGLWVFLANGSGGFHNPAPAWFSEAGQWDLERVRVVGGDVDGDGRDDVIAFYDYGFAKTGVWVFYASGTGTFTPPVQRWMSLSGAWDLNRSRLVGGDVNGDGRDDVVAMYYHGGYSTDLWTFMANEEGGFDHPTKQWSSGPGNWSLDLTARLLGADVNGDGRRDVVAFYDYGQGATSMFVFMADGSGGFGNPTAVWSSGGNWDVGRTRLVSGDVNGDGMDDVMGLYDYGNWTTRLWVFLANGTGGYRNPTEQWYSGERAWDTNRTRLIVGDTTRDGKDDIVAFYDYGMNGTSLWVFQAKGAGGFSAPTLQWSSAAGAWSLASTVPV